MIFCILCVWRWLMVVFCEEIANASMSLMLVFCVLRDG